jgi:hypothetical protein
MTSNHMATTNSESRWNGSVASVNSFAITEAIVAPVLKIDL